jgi:hypothetical protein
MLKKQDGGMKWIYLAQDCGKWRDILKAATNIWVTKYGISWLAEEMLACHGIFWCTELANSLNCSMNKQSPVMSDTLKSSKKPET